MDKLNSVDTSKRKQDRNLTKTEDVEKTLREYINDAQRNMKMTKQSMQKINVLWQKGVGNIADVSKQMSMMSKEIWKSLSDNIKEVSKIMAGASDWFIVKLAASMTQMEEIKKEFSDMQKKNWIDIKFGGVSGLDKSKKAIEDMYKEIYDIFSENYSQAEVFNKIVEKKKSTLTRSAAKDTAAGDWNDREPKFKIDADKSIKKGQESTLSKGSVKIPKWYQEETDFRINEGELKRGNNIKTDYVVENIPDQFPSKNNNLNKSYAVGEVFINNIKADSLEIANKIKYSSKITTDKGWKKKSGAKKRVDKRKALVNNQLAKTDDVDSNKKADFTTSFSDMVNIVAGDFKDKITTISLQDYLIKDSVNMETKPDNIPEYNLGSEFFTNSVTKTFDFMNASADQIEKKFRDSPADLMNVATIINEGLETSKKSIEEEIEKRKALYQIENLATLVKKQDVENELALIEEEKRQKLDAYKNEQLAATDLNTARETSNAEWIKEIKDLAREKKKQDKEDRKNRLSTYKERKKDYESEIQDLENKRKKNGKLSQEEKDRLDKATQNLKDAEDVNKEDLKEERKDNLWKMLGVDPDDPSSPGQKLLESMTKLGGDLRKALDNVVDKYMDSFSSYQKVINTRLQGASNNFESIYKNLKENVGVNAWVKMDDILTNIEKAVESGISYNVEQRAFLNTVKDSVASTFNAFNSNLLQIIRIQQADTTAARLGMESSLTQLFNSAFSDSSYLVDVGTDNITSALSQALSQLSATDSVAIEYQVNKWLGSLYSVGFSSNAVNSIANALGYLGSGNISALSSDEDMQNLMVMSMSRAGLSYSDFLINGLDESNTNKLLKSMVEYLAEISESTNQVVKSEYANIFGVTVSDLAAVQNLLPSINSIAKSSMNYNSALNELYNQMSLSVQKDRLGIAGMIDNLYNNAMYSIAGTYASNPIASITYKVASLVGDVAGGGNIPFINTLFGGIDLNTTVANLMNYGLLGFGLLGSIGSIASGINNSVNPSNMLSNLGIKKESLSVLSRGAIKNSTSGSSSVSTSNYIGNSSGSDVANSVTTQAQNEGQEQLDVKNEEGDKKTTDDIYTLLYETFTDLLNGSSSLSVDVKNTVNVNMQGSYGNSDVGL